VFVWVNTHVNVTRLCLFGLTLMSMSPVFADDKEYKKCDSMGKKRGAKYPYKPRMNCFRDLAKDLIADAVARDITKAQKEITANYGSLIRAMCAKEIDSTSRGVCQMLDENGPLLRGFGSIPDIVGGPLR
jgi:hypothetical protein